MHNVSIRDLDIGDLELSLAIDSKNTGVIFLSTLLSVEVGLVKEDTERCVGWEVLGRLVEFRRVVDGLDGGFDIIELCTLVTSLGGIA